jgi:predicted kinase
MRGRLVVFSGPACAGKSTLAAALAARHGLPHLQMDAARQRILPDSGHTRADRAAAYRAMHYAAELLLGHGVSVILDAPYGHHEDRQEVAGMAASTGARFYLVECAVAPETAVARLRLRGPDPVRVDLTPERVEQLARDFHYYGIGLLLDTGALTPAECLARVEAHLAGGPADPRAWA